MGFAPLRNEEQIYREARSSVLPVNTGNPGLQNDEKTLRFS